MSANLERVEALFGRAIEFRPDQRAAFLKGACDGDLDLLAQVQALLEAHDEDEAILSEQPRTVPAGNLPAESPGDEIGQYKILQQIGEGGCGIVYMAEQQHPVRRRVALKIIRLGMDTRQVVARFEAERQALALMDHPNIARVFEAGATQMGRPFFVMELVRGPKITDYCDELGLATRERLDLFIKVCQAIQHAHQKGVIHRDIKPSNILVTVNDGVAVPKVIDFGIAKATDRQLLTDKTVFTAFEYFIGTPAYMSPEQAGMTGLDIDTRSDIYSLGVLLYELLTSKTPFQTQELLAAGLDEMRRTIREKEPVRPSTRLSSMSQEELTAAARRHQSEPPRLLQSVRGDLDWIVMKCLEKDRARRYETANGLAMDLQRHLMNEPVAARPPSAGYRFRKLVRRNKLVFAAGAAVALALVAGTVGSSWEAIRARRAEREQGRLRAEADGARIAQVKQRAAAEQHLYEALLGEARAKQVSGLAGQRFESLEAISKATAIHTSRELSDEATAAFALWDLRERQSWRFSDHWVAENLCFDDAFELYAFRTPAGISVRRVQGDHDVATWQVKDVDSIPYQVALRRFDRTSRYLAAYCLSRSGQGRCQVWDVKREGTLVLDVPSTDHPDFSPDGRAIAVIDEDNTIVVKEISTRKDLKRLAVESRLGILRFSPDGKRLAGLGIGSSTARIWDLTSGRVVGVCSASATLNSLAWNGDGNLLALGRDDGRIDIWDADSGRMYSRLEGHESKVTTLAFSHQGGLLASMGWDMTLRLWDVANGQQLLIYRTQDTDLHFSQDDRVLAYAVEGDTSKLLEVAPGTGYRRIFNSPELSNCWGGEFSPDGRLLASATKTGIGLVDVVGGRALGFVQTADCRSVHFLTNGGSSLLASTSRGLYHWPLSTEPAPRGPLLRVGAPELLLAGENLLYSALDGGGRKLLATRAGGVEPLLVHLAIPTNVLRFPGHPGAQTAAIDPAGHWAATGTWKGTGVRVFDASTGQLLRELPVKGSAFVAFSPDEEWLATATTTQFGLWKTGTWEFWPQFLAGDRVGELNPLAFSPDGRLLATVHAGCRIRIVRVPSCELVATLRPPTLGGISSIYFSPDGSKLAALEWSGPVSLWDLRLIRGELKKMNLDWDLEPFPPGSEDSGTGPPMRQVDAGPFSQEELARAIPPRATNAPSNLIDLTEYYNAPLTESWHSAKAERNDLSALPRGVQTLGGIEFDVRGLIQIGANAANGLAYPNHVHGIPIGQSCLRLHFLHAAILASSARAGDELGSYIFHYADGRQAELPIIVGRDMADWWSQPKEEGVSFVLGWTGSNPAARAGGCTVRLFQTTWENPLPAVAIRDFDFVSDKPTPGAPFLVAITVEP